MERTAVGNPMLAAILSQGRHRILPRDLCIQKSRLPSVNGDFRIRWDVGTWGEETTAEPSPRKWVTEEHTKDCDHPLAPILTMEELTLFQGCLPHIRSSVENGAIEASGSFSSTLSHSSERAEERKWHWLDWIWGCRLPFPAKRYSNSDLLNIASHYSCPSPQWL